MSIKKHSDQVAARFLQAMKQVIAKDLATSQKDFAEKVGEYAQNISKIESGSRYPTIEMMCNSCIIFNINPSWLLLNSGEMFTSDTKTIGLEERIETIEKELKQIKRKFNFDSKI